MTDAEWVDWCTFHSTLFLFRTKEERAMVGAWRPSLEPYTPAELREASRYLAARTGQPVFPSEHLRHLRSRITERRREQADAAQSQNDFPTIPCQLCRDSGFAVMPHPNFVINGRWESAGMHWPTIAIACRCARGARLHQKAIEYSLQNEKKRKDGGKVKTPCSFDDYAKRNPFWETQLQEVEAIQREEAKARRTAGTQRSIDETIDGIGKR